MLPHCFVPHYNLVYCILRDWRRPATMVQRTRYVYSTSGSWTVSVLDIVCSIGIMSGSSAQYHFNTIDEVVDKTWYSRFAYAN